MKKLYFCLSILGFLITHTGHSQSKHVRFKHFTTEQGLSQSNISHIFQDSRGYMWFGSSDGLNKFDGYTFTIYKNNPKKPNSLSRNGIGGIFEDRQGNLWVSTDGGLDLLDRTTDTFKHFNHNPADPNSISSDRISVLFEDRKGSLWIGTWGGGLNSFDRKTKKFFVFKHNAQQDNSLSSNDIRSLGEDKQGNLWVGTGASGINKFEAASKTFIRYQHNPADSRSISGNEISAIRSDSQGNLWIGIEGKGLNRLDATTGQFIRYQHQQGNLNSLSNDEVLSLSEDRQGNLWIGTRAGVCVYNKQKNIFVNHQKDSNDPYSLTHNSIHSLYKDRTGSMWVGTVVGLNLMEMGSDKFEHFKNDANDPASLSHNTVLGYVEDKAGNLWIGNDAGLERFDRKKGTFEHFGQDAKKGKRGAQLIVNLFEDSKGSIWMGTYNQGLFQFDKSTNTFKQYLPNPTKSGHYLSANNPSSLIEDTQHRLWVSTFSSGLNYLDGEKDSFVDFNTDSTNANKANNDVSAMYMDRKGNFWYATSYGGLFKLALATGKYIQYQHDPKNDKSLSDNFIAHMYEDSKGNFWLGTGAGLNLMDREKGTFTAYREADGLCNNVVLAILEDDKANLWLSTNKGISKFNPQTKTFHNFTIEDGLQANEFGRGSCMKTRNGEMYFGGANGFNVFHPDQVKVNSYIPPVYLTDFQIFNKPVVLGEKKSPLTKHISETKEITLSYQQSVFSFEFSALNYVVSKNNRYAYKMEGFDKDWNYVGSKRSATYTNLDPGEYTFHVKASNNDGVWNEKGTSIQITINPPFWQTWWFRTLVALTVIGSAAGYYKMKIDAIKAQKVELEKQVQERTAEVMQQKEELQSQAENLQIINGELIEQQEEILQQQEELQAQAEVLIQNNDILKEKQEEIEVQRDNLQQVNEHVMSSIQYAKTIQRAILPSQKKIEASLPEHFVLYRPKDVVSGDFYWFSHLPKEDTGREADLTFLAVVDCTGHGVPGAFMSIIGNTLLNEIVNQKHILDPAQILQHLHQGVKQAVEKSEGVNTAGMDVCLIRVERRPGQPNQLAYAGAKRPLYYWQADQLQKLEGDRKSIGSENSSTQSFTTKELTLEDGTWLYLTSDGYVDQNNIERKKLGSAKLCGLIESAHHASSSEQKHLFESVLDQHQQQAEQRDDITLVGVKI